MGELSKRVISLINENRLNAELSVVASFLMPLLKTSTEEVKDIGVESQLLLDAYKKREENLIRRKTEHGGFKESTRSLENASELVDSIAIKAGWYFAQILIDPEREKIVSMVYVKQKTSDFTLQSTK